MPRNNQKRDPIPEQFASIEEAAEFWDTHDLTDYENVWHDVTFQVNLKRPSKSSIELESQVADEFAKRARAKKMSLDAFVNHILKEYLKQRAA